MKKLHKEWRNVRRNKERAGTTVEMKRISPKLDDLFDIARNGAIELLTHEEESAVSLSDKCVKVQGFQTTCGTFLRSW